MSFLGLSEINFFSQNLKTWERTPIKSAVFDIVKYELSSYIIKHQYYLNFDFKTFEE